MKTDLFLATTKPHTAQLCCMNCPRVSTGEGLCPGGTGAAHSPWLGEAGSCAGALREEGAGSSTAKAGPAGTVRVRCLLPPRYMPAQRARVQPCFLGCVQAGMPHSRQPPLRRVRCFARRLLLLLQAHRRGELGSSPKCQTVMNRQHRKMRAKSKA